jgi:hypothetical protein
MPGPSPTRTGSCGRPHRSESDGAAAPSAHRPRPEALTFDPIRGSWQLGPSASAIGSPKSRSRSEGVGVGRFYLRERTSRLSSLSSGSGRGTGRSRGIARRSSISLLASPLPWESASSRPPRGSRDPDLRALPASTPGTQVGSTTPHVVRRGCDLRTGTRERARHELRSERRPHSQFVPSRLEGGAEVKARPRAPVPGHRGRRSWGDRCPARRSARPCSADRLD